VQINTLLRHQNEKKYACVVLALPNRGTHYKHVKS
jgi:hypothetical protein